MTRTELWIHIIVAAGWIGLAVVLGLKIALLGNEEAALNRSRGLDRKAQLDLGFQQEKLRSQLDYDASAPALEKAIRQLQLPLQPPMRMAAR
jgi:hypothetical protein